MDLGDGKLSVILKMTNSERLVLRLTDRLLRDQSARNSLGNRFTNSQCLAVLPSVAMVPKGEVTGLCIIGWQVFHSCFNPDHLVMEPSQEDRDRNTCKAASQYYKRSIRTALSSTLLEAIYAMLQPIPGILATLWQQLLGISGTIYSL